MTILTNFPFIASFTSILLAQFVKVPLNYITNRTLNFGLSFSTGGMPSSHSAAVASLSTAIGISSGVSSSLFAISMVFSVIIMFDAAGIRRHAGEQAVVINRLIEEFRDFFNEMKALPNKPEFEQRKALKELLGHRPIEVIVGGLFGIGISLLLYIIFYR